MSDLPAIKAALARLVGQRNAIQTALNKAVAGLQKAARSLTDDQVAQIKAGNESGLESFFRQREEHDLFQEAVERSLLRLASAEAVIHAGVTHDAVDAVDLEPVKLKTDVFLEAMGLPLVEMPRASADEAPTKDAREKDDEGAKENS